MINPKDPGLLPSVFHRLIDPESRGTVARPGYSLDQMIRSVQEDLEKLLNTRQVITEVGERYARTRQVLGYGMPDLTSYNHVTDQERHEIGQSLEEVILHYEPRLKDVRVQLRSNPQEHHLKVRFHIEAKLAVDPAPEVAFDTTLELFSGHFVGDKP